MQDVTKASPESSAFPTNGDFDEVPSGKCIARGRSRMDVAPGWQVVLHPSRAVASVSPIVTHEGGIVDAKGILFEGELLGDLSATYLRLECRIDPAKWLQVGPRALKFLLTKPLDLEADSDSSAAVSIRIGHRSGEKLIEDFRVIWRGTSQPEVDHEVALDADMVRRVDEIAERIQTKPDDSLWLAFAIHSPRVCFALHVVSLKGGEQSSSLKPSSIEERASGKMQPIVALSNGQSKSEENVNHDLGASATKNQKKTIGALGEVGKHPSGSAHEIIVASARQSTNYSLPRKAEMPRERQDHVVLLWGPISTSGLTIQLQQVADILNKNKVLFQVSYHIGPTVDHSLCKHWIEPKHIDNPKMVIFFERFHQFDRGFERSFKVFYLNLDWLSEKTLSLAKVHSKVIFAPTPYKLEELTRVFQNSKIVHLPWPACFKPVSKPESTSERNRIRVLYVGNDYNESSRKHPREVVEAIGQLERKDIVFDLKFRSALPRDVFEELAKNPIVDNIIDCSTDHDVIEKLYLEADINLIPNACEGNGLSILESWASGTVPAVLDGHPMIDVTSPQNSYRISCGEIGKQEHAPYYKTGSKELLDFLNGLDIVSLQAKKDVVRDMAGRLEEREKELETAIMSCVMLSGIRTKGIRQRIENAHLQLKKYANWQPRDGRRVRDLLFSDEGQSRFLRQPKLVDVLLTTSQRPWCLRESIHQLLKAMRHSRYQHRLLVAVDKLDPGTLAILNEHSSEIDQVLWTKNQQGLPYVWNSLNNLLCNTINRTELRPDYVCYIQDDCYINDPLIYFDAMVGVAADAMAGYLGFVSGYYTEVHPGFADFDWRGHRVIASDSIDGKNFMASPEVLNSTGGLTWWFNDGTRRGNPGPVRGSHFDLWQWKEAPNSLMQQSRISLVLPDLCQHIAGRAEESTWNNDTTDDAVKRRIEARKIYETRNSAQDLLSRGSA
jgi:hypothetical protein